MSVHLATPEGKAKCGSRSYWGYGTYLEKLPNVPANCKRCLGKVEKRYETIAFDPSYLGKIIHRSFGYDMTFNVYAKIIKLNAKSATAIEIKTMTVAGEPYGHMGTGRVRPLHEPVGEPFIIYLKKFKQGEWTSIVGDGNSWSLWDGQSNYENHWD